MFSYLLPAAVLATLVFSSPLWEGLFLCSLANMFSAAACLILPPNCLAGKLCRTTGETAGLYFCFWVSQDFLPAPSKEWLCTFWWVLKNRTRLEMVKLHFYFYLKGVISTCVLVRCLSPVTCAALFLLHMLWGSPLMALLSAFLTLEVQMPKENSVWPLWTLSYGKLSRATSLAFFRL